MSKKPKLALVDRTPATPSAPPATLGKAGRTLWAAILSEYDIQDAGGLATLGQICAATDRIAEFAAIISRDGATIVTMSGPREHPLLKVELATRAFVTRALARLNLDVEPIKGVGRPSHGFGWVPPS